MRVEYIRLKDVGKYNTTFVDITLSKGLRNDFINDQVFFEIGISLNPSQDDIIDYGKNVYISMNPPGIKEKRSEYNQKALSYTNEHIDEINKHLMISSMRNYIYRRLWETVMLRRESGNSSYNHFTSTIVTDPDTFIPNGKILVNLVISLGEAMACVFAMTTNQVDIRKKVNDMMTSIYAVQGMLEDSLIRDEKMRRLNLSNVLSTLRFTSYSWNSTYDTSRVQKLRSISNNDILADVQYLNCDIHDVVKQGLNSDIFVTFTCAHNDIIDLCPYLNDRNVTDICVTENDISVTIVDHIGSADITIINLIKETYNL